MAETKKNNKFEVQQVGERFTGNEDRWLDKTYRHNFKVVRNFIVKNNGTEAEAKDIFQDAMMITWMNMKEGKFEMKNEFALGAYIYKIAKYKWIDKLKSKERKSVFRSHQIEFESVESNDVDYHETEANLQYLMSLYGQLNAKCKEVLNKFYFDKKKLEEIASELNYDTGSIRTIKYRCMQKLREMHAERQTKLKEL
jgi:RNA polymerase sigma factor (sigma-70 family)